MGGSDSFPDLSRAFSLFIASELFVVDMGDVDENIDAVQQWPAYSLLVAGDFAGRAFTFLEGVSVVAAGARVKNVIEYCLIPLATLY